MAAEGVTSVHITFKGSQFHESVYKVLLNMWFDESEGFLCCCRIVQLPLVAESAKKQPRKNTQDNN
jgi:hypothetical protein